MAFPIYTTLIVKADQNSLNQVQAQVRKTFSNNAISIDISKDASLQQVEKALKGIRKESTGLVGDLQSVGKQVDTVFRRFSAYLIASGTILTAISGFKSLITEAVKFQDELIKIKQVSGDADSQVKILGKTVGDLSRTLGVSSAELIKSATVLKQAGLSTKDTIIAMQTLAKTDLAPNFDSIAKTTEGLIAIFQQFGRDITKIDAQLGSLNAVAGAFAVEASDLITTVQKAGGAAASSGASFEELLGLFTSVRATTRESADAIATGLRTIFGRLQRPDTLKFLEDLGIKLRYTAEEAKEAGKQSGAFVGPFEAILRIAQGTSGLGQGSTLFSTIIEQVGGLRQLSRVVPLLRETTLAIEAYNVAQAGQKSLDIQALQKQDSYLNKLVKIKEEFLAIGRTLVESEGFDRFIKFMESAASAATRLLSVLAPLIPYVGVLFASNLIAGSTKEFAKNTIRGFGGPINQPIPMRKGMASGGIVPGPSDGDKFPAMLEGGEAVIPAKSVRKYPDFVRGLISGGLPGFADGYIPVKGGSESQRDLLSRLMEKVFKVSGITPEAFNTSKVSILPMGENGPAGQYRYFLNSLAKGKIRINDLILSNPDIAKRVLSHELGHGLHRKLGHFAIPEEIKRQFLQSEPKYAKLIAGVKSGSVPQGKLDRFISDKEIFARMAESRIMDDNDLQGLLSELGVSKKDVSSVSSRGMLGNIARKISNFAVSSPEQQPVGPGRFDWIGEKGNALVNKVAGGIGGVLSSKIPLPTMSGINRGADSINNFLERSIGDTVRGLFSKQTLNTIIEPFKSQKLEPKILKSNRPVTQGLRDYMSQNEKVFDSLAEMSAPNTNYISPARAKASSVVQKKIADIKDEIATLELNKNQAEAYATKYKLRRRDGSFNIDKTMLPAGKELDYLSNPQYFDNKLKALQSNLTRATGLSYRIASGPNIKSGISTDNGWGGYSTVSPNNPEFTINPPTGNKVPFVPGGVGYRGGYSGPPPIGPFGYGRNGSSGDDDNSGSGSSGGRKGGSRKSVLENNGLPSADSVISRINGNRWANFGASSLGIGLPLGLATIATQSPDPATQNEAGTASLLSGIGGALGGAFGPWGAAIGAGIGAIAGWWMGAAQASKELEQTAAKNKVDDSVKKLAESIENISQGSGSIGDLADSLDRVRKESLEKALVETKDGGNVIKAFSNEFRKNAGLQLAPSQKILNEEIKKQARFGQPLDITNSDTSRVVQTIANLRGTSIGTIAKESQRLYDAARLDQIRKESASKFVLEIDKSVASATAFADAVSRAADDTDRLDEQLRLITSGGYARGSFNVGEFGNINKDVLGRLSGLGGGALGQLTGTVCSVNDIANYLPDVLSRVIKPGEQTSDNLADSFESVFADIGQKAGISFDKRVIGAFANKLQSLKSEELFEDFRKAPEKFAKDFLNAYEPSLKALQSIGKNLEERDKAYQDGLRQLLGINDKINGLYEQANASGTQYLTTRRNFILGNLGANPADNIDTSIIFKQFNKEQDRLLGTKGIGEDPKAIANLISKLKEEEKILQEKAKAEANNIKGSTQFRDELNKNQIALNNANRALERLANTADRISIIQQETESFERRKNAKLSLIETELTATPQEFRQRQFDALAARLVGQNGAFNTIQRFNGIGLQAGQPGLGNAVFAQALRFLRSLPEEQKIQSRFSGVDEKGNRIDISGPAIAKKLLEEYSEQLANNALNIAPEQRGIRRNQRRILGIMEAAGGNPLVEGAAGGINGVGGALGVMIANNEKTFQDFANALKENNKEFFTSINKYIAELQKTAQQTELSTKRTELSSIESKARGAEALSGIDIPTAKLQAGRIQSYKNAKTDLEASNIALNNLKPSIDSFVEKNKNLSPLQLSLALQKEFGLSEETTSAISNNLTTTSIRNDPVLQFKNKGKIDDDTFRAAQLEPNKRGVVDKKEIFNLIKLGAISNARNKLASTRAGLDERLLNLPQESIDLLKGSENPQDILNRINKLKTEIAVLEGRAPQNIGQRPRVFPNLTPSIPGFGSLVQNANQLFVPPEANIPAVPRVNVQGRGTNIPGIGPISSFEKAGEILGNFSVNFGKQIEALAAIPRTIDMNVNQRVEVIINGADILNNLEPGMKQIANGAVARAIEVIGAQLRESNISINYNPNENPNAEQRA